MKKQILQTPLREFEPYPGLFYYSGFGYGDLYLPDGGSEWLCHSDAVKRCRELGLTFSYVDSLEGYNPPYLGD